MLSMLHFIISKYLYTCCVSWPSPGCLSSVYLYRLLGAFDSILISYHDNVSLNTSTKKRSFEFANFDESDNSSSSEDGLTPIFPWVYLKMLASQVLLVCLLNYAVDRTTDLQTYVLCPGSLSCVCPYNMTGAPDTGPRCMDLRVVKKMCPVNKYFFINILVNYI